jgi:hypothetical protein
VASDIYADVIERCDPVAGPNGTGPEQGCSAGWSDKREGNGGNGGGNQVAARVIQRDVDCRTESLASFPVRRLDGEGNTGRGFDLGRRVVAGKGEGG